MKAIMWREMISELSQDYKFHTPLSEEWIDKGLADLGVRLNDNLKSFLLETDGLYDYRQFLWVVWNVRDLLTYNQEMWKSQEFADKGFMVDDLFFIANFGIDGILFSFRIVNNKLQDDIVAWFPETKERKTVAVNIKDYLERWINKDLL